MLAHGRVIAEGTLQEIYAQTETTNLRDAFKKLIPCRKGGNVMNFKVIKQLYKKEILDVLRDKRRSL